MKSEFDAKKFVQLFMAGYVPRSKDEKKFVDKHVAQLHQDVNGNKDDVFKATNVPTHARPPYHGYNKGQDERMYEDVEQIDEISKAKLFNYINSAATDLRIKSFDAGAEPKKDTDKDSKKRSRRQAGIGRAAKKLAFGKVSEAIELIEEEMTDAQMAKRERIVKSMKKKSATFEKRYGEKAKDVMYATATKMAMEDLNYVNLEMLDEMFAVIEEYEEKEDREKKGLKHIESHAKKVREVTKKYPVAQRNESVIDQMIAAMDLDEEIITITFDNGEEAELERDITESILNIFSDLSEENQFNFEEAISEGIEAFEHALAFIAEAYEGAE